MKISKRLLAIIMVLLTAFSLFCGCASEKQETSVSQTEEKQEPEQSEADEPNAKEIVASMTLREKIGQMIMPAARQWSDTPLFENSYQDMTVLEDEVANAISEYNLCGICLFGQNCVSTEQLVQLTTDLQSAASKSSSGIPLLISADQEGGYVVRLSSGTSMIGNMALAATGDSANAKTEAEIISSELSAVGINVDFAPDSDVNDNPENPVIGIRSFSDNADTVSEYSGAYIEGLHENNIISCLKHFPGHGNTSTDSHTGFPTVDKSLEELEENELVPFASLANETDMIMTAHIQYPQIETETYISTSTGEAVNLPATMSETIIRGILREDMGFNGVVVTDSLEMDAIDENFQLNDVVKAAINADVDLLLMPLDLTDSKKIEALGTLISDIEAMVNNGEIKESEIDDSVTRIISLKLERGIMGNSDENNLSAEERTKQALATVGSKEHHDIEWELAQKAITLYQDKNGTYANGFGATENVLYLYPSSSQELSPDLALQKLFEEGYNTDGITFEKICYDGLTLQDVSEALNCADRVILVTKTGSLSALDTSNSDNTNAIFCTSVIAEAKNQGKELGLISSLLPYDAEFYKDADVILLAYNPIGVSELPQSYDGHVSRYGVNLPAAIASLITGRTLTATCPVNMSNLPF